MAVCPDCSQELVQIMGEKGARWECERCHGAALSGTLMAKLIPEAEFSALLKNARDGLGSSRRPCAICANYMAVVAITGNDLIEVCPSCHSAWIKAAVLAKPPYAVLPKPAPEPVPAPKPAAKPAEKPPITRAAAEPPAKADAGRFAMPDNLTPEQRARVAQLYVKMLEQDDRSRRTTARKASNWLRWLPLLFGIPIIPRKKK